MGSAQKKILDQIMIKKLAQTKHMFKMKEKGEEKSMQNINTKAKHNTRKIILRLNILKNLALICLEKKYITGIIILKMTYLF